MQRKVRRGAVGKMKKGRTTKRLEMHLEDLPRIPSTCLSPI